MTRLVKRVLSVIVYPEVCVLLVFCVSGSAVHAAPGGTAGSGRGGGGRAAVADNGPRTLAPFFTPTNTGAKAPDSDGFLQRWLLLEPIPNQLRTNAGFTEAFVRSAFQTDYFKDQYTVTPKDGDKVTVKGQELAWHALDSTLFNVKLYRFAYGLDKPTYGVTFFAYTTVESPREMKNVRMAVGSNSASLWWLNGQEAVGLFGDRRMVMDDCLSKRLTLTKGKNVIRGAVINGPGMSDFCVRFLDENDNPIKDLTTSFDQSQK
jgi:hypothetical protein